MLDCHLHLLRLFHMQVYNLALTTHSSDGLQQVYYTILFFSIVRFFFFFLVAYLAPYLTVSLEMIFAVVEPPPLP